MNLCVRLRSRWPSAIMRPLATNPPRAPVRWRHEGFRMSAAAIYARYSSDLQPEASIEDQNRICRERAAQEGWSIYQEYSDSGISAASLARPGIQKLLRDAQAGRFEILLAESIDRQSRDQEDRSLDRASEPRRTRTYARNGRAFFARSRGPA
jgi:hypothetical protein